MALTDLEKWVQDHGVVATLDADFARRVEIYVVIHQAMYLLKDTPLTEETARQALEELFKGIFRVRFVSLQRYVAAAKQRGIQTALGPKGGSVGVSIWVPRPSSRRKTVLIHLEPYREETIVPYQTEV